MTKVTITHSPSETKSRKLGSKSQQLLMANVIKEIILFMKKMAFSPGTEIRIIYVLAAITQLSNLSDEQNKKTSTLERNMMTLSPF